MKLLPTKREFLRWTSMFPLFCATIVVLLFGALHVGEAIAPKWEIGTTEELLDIRPDAEGSQAAAIAGADCVEASGGVIGTRVVFDIPLDGKGWRVGGEAAVGRAFEQLVFDGVLEANEWTQPVNHGMTVGVFCR
jgi:hypothetical protein